jgi:tetratricopeptide (TPR) repeat protein
VLGEGLSGDGAVAVTQVDAIHGLGGVGKTQLAARYARTRRDAYDVIWWLRCEQPATLRVDLAALAVALGLVDVDVDVEEPDAVAVARDWLERSQRWLLVFDNAPSPGAIADLVPESGGGHVLITSRAHADWRSLGARPIALNVWERKESQAFLCERTAEHDDGALDDVADALGDLPLALEQAAAYINAKVITAAGYVQRLRERAPELFAAGQPVGYGHTVATVWSLAFTELAEQPVARELVGVCAHLAAERIPRELLDAIGDVGEDPKVTVTAQAVDNAVELLLGYALLTATTDSTLGMHRLVQDVARSSAGPQGCAAAAARTVALIDRVLPGRPWEHEQWPGCARLLEHAMTATSWAEQHNVAREQTARVLARVGQYHEARAAYVTARELLQRALAIQEAIYGPEHPEVAGTLGNLGIVQRQLGEFEAARASLQRALAIKEAVYGPEHPEVAGTLGNLGIDVIAVADPRVRGRAMSPASSMSTMSTNSGPRIRRPASTARAGAQPAPAAAGPAPVRRGVAARTRRVSPCRGPLRPSSCGSSLPAAPATPTWSAQFSSRIARCRVVLVVRAYRVRDPAAARLVADMSTTRTPSSHRSRHPQGGHSERYFNLG